MKVALALCMALLAVVLLQAEDEMGPPIRRGAVTRIHNSRPATPRQFPYMAYVQPGGTIDTVCAGSLIRRTAVLTTAWCVGGFRALKDPIYYTVRLGSIYCTQEDPNAWTAVSTWAVVHPKYNPKNEDNNIAIINLPSLAPLNEFIQPLYLPRSSDDSSYVGRQAMVSAWGEPDSSTSISEVLRWAEVLVIPNQHCKKAFSDTDLVVTDRQLCAGSNTSTVSIFDYGAPLVLYTRGRYTQIAIFSKRKFQADNTSTPALYTRVTSFMDWIIMNMGSD